MASYLSYRYLRLLSHFGQSYSSCSASVSHISEAKLREDMGSVPCVGELLLERGLADILFIALLKPSFSPYQYEKVEWGSSIQKVGQAEHCGVFLSGLIALPLSQDTGAIRCGLLGILVFIWPLLSPPLHFLVDRPIVKALLGNPLKYDTLNTSNFFHPLAELQALWMTTWLKGCHHKWRFVFVTLSDFPS